MKSGWGGGRAVRWERENYVAARSRRVATALHYTTVARLQGTAHRSELGDHNVMPRLDAAIAEP